jgi:hypothetical protein
LETDRTRARERSFTVAFFWESFRPVPSSDWVLDREKNMYIFFHEIAKQNQIEKNTIRSFFLFLASVREKNKKFEARAVLFCSGT